MFDSTRSGQSPSAVAEAQYSDGVTVHASEIAAALRERLPGLGRTKLHKLLYYCQGHHLAHSGQPLFRERISAWDHGPVVGELWKAEEDGPVEASTAGLGEDVLNTIGYVVSRYGRLSARDLENLTHAEAPWRRADTGRPPKGSEPIRIEWLTEHFTSPEADEDDEPIFDRDVLDSWLAGSAEREKRPARPDSLASLRARLADAS